jgi:hypothetical protein
VTPNFGRVAKIFPFDRSRYEDPESVFEWEEHNMSENQQSDPLSGQDGGSELAAAEAHLHRAEADLKAAHGEEEKAEHEIGEAVREIEEAAHHPDVIHFTLDGEAQETRHHKLTPDQIISEFGKQDPATNYLVEIKGTHKISFQGKGDEEIKLHDGMNFQIISTGPKPVSDETGSSAFMDGLRALGYEPKCLASLSDHVFVDYLVEIGRFAGRVVRIGFVVPPDFPNIPPGGPHISPSILPLHPANDVPHPVGGVHGSSSTQFEQKAGGSWQYWSRPFVSWAQSKRTVSAYMAHIWRLWETQ